MEDKERRETCGNCIWSTPSYKGIYCTKRKKKVSASGACASQTMKVKG